MTIPEEVGSVYDCGFVSPTHGNLGVTIKPGTYWSDQQLLKRQEVVAALQQAIADRDIEFWTRQSQFDWSKGQGQELMGDPSRYSKAFGIDVHTLGALRLVPMPVLVASNNIEIKGRGAALAVTAFANGTAAMFFPWSDGNYIYSTNGGVTWLASTTPAGGKISDIATNGNTLWFSFYNVGGVWTTNAGAPGALTQYDVGANRYTKLVYDPLRKNLYGITGADFAVALHKINAGAGPTTVFDWLVGRLDALDLYQGNVVVSWNQAAFARGAGPSRIYQYDGTSVTKLAEMPDGVFVTGLRGILGFLFICGMESDPFSPATDRAGVYFMLGSTGPTRIDSIDGFNLDDIASACFLGYPHFMFSQGSSLFVCTQARVQRYDIVNGGVSRSLGDDAIAGLASAHLQGAVAIRGAIFGVLGLIGTVLAGVVRLNPTGAGGLISTSGNTGQQLTSSRFDLGLPYVDKYWYAIESVCDPLIAGQQIAMEYSLDDGASWTACGGSPLTTVGTKRFNFLVQKVNAHLRYRVTPIAAAATATPVIHGIALRFAPSNPNAKVWTFTVEAKDSIRLRNSKVSDVSGQDIIAYLYNIAKQNETVTFYDNNEPLLAGGARVAHTVWVMQASQSTFNTGGIYSPVRQEGELPLVLWEVTG